MNANEALQNYLGLKLHFSSLSYDYEKFGGKTKHPAKLENRPDKFYFEKLAKRKDVWGRLVSNFVINPRAHIKDIVGTEGDAIYMAWRARHESLKYHIKEQMGKIKETLPQGLKVVNGQHPEVLKMYLRKDISIEALSMLDSFTGLFKTWDKQLNDPVWKNVRIPLLKYGKMLHFDRTEMSKIIKEELC